MASATIPTHPILENPHVADPLRLASFLRRVAISCGDTAMILPPGPARSILADRAIRAAQAALALEEQARSGVAR